MEQREINKLHLVRLGKILNNFTILGLVYMLLTTLMPVLSFLSFVAVGIVLILAIFPWIFSGFQLDLKKIIEWFNPEFNSRIQQYLYTGLPYVFGISVAFAVASAAILLLDKNEKHTGRIAVAILALIVGVIAIIMKVTGASI